MPVKLNMIISNGNPSPAMIKNYNATLGVPSVKTPSAINAPMLARIHNVRPGCGSCGRH